MRDLWITENLKKGIVMFLALLLLVGDITGSVPYSQAYYSAGLAEKPMLVVIGADWCPACVDLTNNVIEPLAKSNKLKDINVVYLDFDKNPELCRQMMTGNTIPQTIMYRLKNGKWIKRQVTGRVSGDRILNLLK